MRGAKRRHRSQNQAERRAKPARRSSRCIYPKTAAQKLHQSRSVLKNQNPQNGQHWTRFDWGSGAVCFGASPVAAVFGSAPGSATPPEHRIHCKPAPPAPPFKQDISTLLGVGHFYFALTWGNFFGLGRATRDSETRRITCLLLTYYREPEYVLGGGIIIGSPICPFCLAV